MSGSGSRDGYGEPPWEPAAPVPKLDDTQAIPGLGPGPGPEQGAPQYNGSQNGSPQNGSPQYGSPQYGGSQNGSQQYNGSQNGSQQYGSQQYNGSQNGSQQYGSQQYNGSQNGSQQYGSQQYNGSPNGSAQYGSRQYGAPAQGGPRQDDWDEQGPWSSGPGGNGTRPGSDDPGTGAPGTPGGGAHRRRPKRRRSFWRELPVLVVVALVLALVIKSFAIQAFFIPSSSMENTLEVNDRVLINKIVYHLRPIHRGDIVVFDGTGSWDPATHKGSNIFSKAADELEGIVGISHDTSIYIKRVIGLPGDHVKCCNKLGQVTVNGTPLHEIGYLYPGNQPSATPINITVPAGRLWVMGDHRAVSYDSRGHQEMPGDGTIPESAVLGRAFVIIWPPSRWGFLNIPATFEEPKLNAPPSQGGNAAAGGSSAALESALDNGTPVTPATSPLPLALGFIGAVPITWLQRKARNRRTRRRAARGQ